MTHAGPELAKSGHMADKERTHGGHTRGRRKRRARFGGRHKAKVWRRSQSGHVADTWRAHGGHMADKWQFGGGARSGLRHTRRTQGGRTQGGQGLEARPSALKGGHKASHGGQSVGTWPMRNQGGHKADNGGHMADKLRGRGQSISRPALFF